MNCFNCGASVSGEHKNCPYCGQSMQIVPDYNFLDDDNINVIMEESNNIEESKNVDEEAAERIKERKRQEREREKQRRLERKKQRQMIIIFIAVVVVCGILFAAFFGVNEYVQKQNENSYDYQIKQAETALKADDFDSAKEYYYKALALKPEDLEVRFTLAELYSDKNMKKEMVAMYKDILAIDAKNYTAYKMLFQYYNSINDVNAILELRKGVTDDRIMALFEDYAVENPKIYLKGDSYKGAIDVMVTAKMNYEIYYTLDGSDPTKNGIKYTETIKISKQGMVTLKVAAKNPKGVFSDVVQETYYLELKAPDSPVMKPADVYRFEKLTSLELIFESGCTAYYAWDMPGAASTILAEDANRLAYVDGIVIPSGKHILTLVVIDNNTGLASEPFRHMYECTEEGIPVPEQFIPVPSESEEETTESEIIDSTTTDSENTDTDASSEPSEQV